MFKSRISFVKKQAALFFMALSFVSACTTKSNTATAAPELQQLRVTNHGSADIAGLVVLFPNGPGWDAGVSRIDFGNVPAGQTSEYRIIPSGVYRYAAYEYRLENNIVHQPVIDWMGESPMTGQKFTYQISLDLEKVEGGQIILAAVLIDEP